MYLLFYCLAGMKTLADILHGILKEWGISASADASPSAWEGVTCADKSNDIVQLNLRASNLRGNNSI